MSTCLKSLRARVAALALMLAGASGVFAQPAAPDDPQKAVRVLIPADAPLSAVSLDLSETEIYLRGPALMIDLRARLVLRNQGVKPVRGAAFSVVAQKVTAGGKASVAAPSLNVPPGETFPVSLSLRLLHPVPAPESGLVEVRLDGVLFEDFSFWGPDRLDSRRRLTVWEMEAERDREHFRRILETQGKDALRRAMLASLDRQGRLPRLEARLAGRGRMVSAAVGASVRREVELAMLDLPGAPLEAMSGVATVAGPVASSPRIAVRNRSEKPIRYFELGWLVRDGAGRLHEAGAVPGPETTLAPGDRAETERQRSFRFTQAGRSGASEFPVKAMGAYVRQVQFADGEYWIPSREALADAGLLDAVPVSAEEQRLSEIYRKQGIASLVEELSRF